MNGTPPLIYPVVVWQGVPKEPDKKKQRISREIAGVAIQNFDRNQLTVTIHARICDCLDFSERRTWSLANRGFTQMVEDGPFYKKIIYDCGIPQPSPFKTYAKQVYAAIESGRGDVMLTMANSLYKFGDPYGPKMVYITSLVNRSKNTKYPLTPALALSGRELAHSLMFVGIPNSLKDLSRREIAEADQALAQQSKLDRVRRHFRYIDRALYGFCEPEVVHDARGMANAICDDKDLPEAIHRASQLCRDVLDHLAATTLGAKNAIWKRCQDQFNNMRGSRTKTLIEVLDMQQQLANKDLNRAQKNKTVSTLFRLFQNRGRSPRLRALAGLSAARYQLESPPDCNDNVIRRMLNSLSAQEYSRPDVRLAARMCLASFQWQNRLRDPNYRDIDIALLAHGVLQSPPHWGHGLGFDGQLWAKEILARLQFEGRVQSMSPLTALCCAHDASHNIDSTLAQTNRLKYITAFFRYCIKDPTAEEKKHPFKDSHAVDALNSLLDTTTGSDIHLDICLLLANMHVEGRTLKRQMSDIKALSLANQVWNERAADSRRWFDAGLALAQLEFLMDSDESGIRHLREVLASPFIEQTHEAKLLLAKYYVDNPTTTHVTRAEVIAFCEEIHANSIIPMETRIQAFDLLSSIRQVQLSP